MYLPNWMRCTFLIFVASSCAESSWSSWSPLSFRFFRFLPRCKTRRRTAAGERTAAGATGAARAHLLLLAARVRLLDLLEIQAFFRHPLIQSPIDCGSHGVSRGRGWANWLGEAARTLHVVHVVLKGLGDRVPLPVQHLRLV